MLLNGQCWRSGHDMSLDCIDKAANLGSSTANSIFVICYGLKMAFCNFKIAIIQHTPLLVRFCGVV